MGLILPPPTIFPLANCVYLDTEASKLAAIGLKAFTTAQAAYDYATTVSPSVIMVGKGSFGNIVLTADWNVDVQISGLGKELSKIGIIDGSLGGYTTDLKLFSCAINQIISTGNPAGNITVKSDGTGAIVGLDDNFGILDASTLTDGGVAGDILLEDIIFDDLNGTILSSSMVANGDIKNGNITIRRSVIKGDIVMGVIDGIPTSRTVTSTLTVEDSKIKTVRFLSNGSVNNPFFGGVMICKNSEIVAHANLFCIQGIMEASVFLNTQFETIDSQRDCIFLLEENGAQFINCVFRPNGTGKPISASSAKTIVAYNTMSRNNLDANVTISDGSNNIFNAAI